MNKLYSYFMVVFLFLAVVILYPIGWLIGLFFDVKQKEMSAEHLELHDKVREGLYD